MYKSVTCFYFAWLMLFCIINRAGAQNDVNFTTLTVKQGLSSNTVNDILKDNYGFMWFATANGLCRYDGSNFTTYRHDADKPNSLPANQVLTLYQDHNGTIWIGSEGGGICYYDRKFDRFISFKGDGSWADVDKISPRAYLQDHTGKIWVGTYTDLRTINPATGQIIKLPLQSPNRNQAGTFVVLSILEDSHKRMWVGTNNGLFLYNWQQNSFTHFAHNNNDKNSLSNDIVKSITEDAEGNIWFGTYIGLNKWLPGGRFQTFRHNAGNNQSLNNDAVFALSADKGNKLWIGTESGVDVMDTRTCTFNHFEPDPRNAFSIKSKSIRSIFIDPSGIYWIGSYDGGISKYNKGLALFNLKQSNPFDPSGLKSPIISAFAEYNKEHVFIGTDGAGVQLFNERTGLFSSYHISSKLPFSRNGLTIMALLHDTKGKLWAGAYNDGLFCIDPATGAYRQFTADSTAKGLSDNNITSLLQDRDGKIWVGTLGHGIDIYDDRTGKFERLNNRQTGIPTSRRLPLNGFITSLMQTANGDVWIGSTGTGIAVYHPADKTFTHLSKAGNNLADNVVQTMLMAKDGTVWVGTNSGISCFDAAKNKFISYTEKQGLANSYIKCILEDANGLLWLSTDRGISSFDRRKKTFRNFNDENGIQQSSFLGNSGLKTSNGNLYFGGEEGFNFFNPATLPLPSKPGPVLLTDLKVNNVSVPPGQKSVIKEQIGATQQIRLHYGQNFSISYVAVDYTSPKQINYAYKLVGFDKDWNYVHKTSIANYTNIDPGEYTFQVKASNCNNNAWSNTITQIKVIVLPPFWRTGYAYLCYFILAGGILFNIRRSGIKKIHRKFELEQEKQKAKQQIEQERREAERLHELDMLKIKFLTDLSHEFRTPISLIAAPVDKLLEKDLADDVSDDLRMIGRNVRRLLNLVNQLLDFRKMEEHELKLNLTPGDIALFVRESAESFNDIAAKKQISLSIDTVPTVFMTLFDHDKLERIIFNLLSNAFKFTPKGGSVTLQTLISTHADGLPCLQLTISDTGIGVPHQDLDKIFDRFYQTQQAGSILNQGSGIGLSIVREFATLHGGSITAERLPEQGMRFVVQLQLTPANEFTDAATDTLTASTNAVNTDQAVAPDKSATVLLVEDNDEFRTYLAQHLKQYYNIVEACNGKEGWQKALSVHPQLVVSDISMPQMTGIELSKKLKADKRTSHIPVILLTAMTGEEDQLKGLKSGASDYLTKPFNFQILHARIGNLLNLNQSLKNTYSKQIHLVGQQIATESADLKLLNAVMKYIEDKLSDPDLSVEDLSKHVGMSRGSLYYKLIELTGTTPVEYIRSVKLDKAASLLETSDYNVAQIAYMTGFGTPSYFSRMFKTKFGMLPSEYLHCRRNQQTAKISNAEMVV